MAISLDTSLTMSERIQRAVAALNVIAGRASGARAVLSSALELIDASSAMGEIKVPLDVRDRLARLLLEAASKAIDFQSAIEALKDLQETTT